MKKAVECAPAVENAKSQTTTSLEAEGTVTTSQAVKATEQP
jgi:hypothetical protein